MLGGTTLSAHISTRSQKNTATKARKHQLEESPIVQCPWLVLGWFVHQKRAPARISEAFLSTILALLEISFNVCRLSSQLNARWPSQMAIHIFEHTRTHTLIQTRIVQSSKHEKGGTLLTGSDCVVSLDIQSNIDARTLSQFPELFGNVFWSDKTPQAANAGICDAERDSSFCRSAATKTRNGLCRIDARDGDSEVSGKISYASFSQPTSRESTTSESWRMSYQNKISTVAAYLRLLAQSTDKVLYYVLDFTFYYVLD